MPHIAVIIAAILAMLFNAVEGPRARREPAGTSADQAPGVVMMVLDQVEHRA